MTVREMHIQVQQGLQHIAANRTRKFYSDEIDLVLNKIQDRFIQSKLRPRLDRTGKPTGGFELDELHTDAIRMLLVTNRILTPYIADTRRYKCMLPADYQYLISDASYTSELCGSIPVLATDNLYITRLQQNQSTKAGSPFYGTNVVIMPDKTVHIPTDLPYGNTYAGYPDVKDISFLIPWINWKGGWYWERFDDLYYPSNYLQMQLTVPIAAKITIDGTDALITEVTQKVYQRHTNPGQYRANRLTPSESIPYLNASSYYRSSYYSPISEISGHTLWLYRDNSFTVNSVEVSYIRKPQPISLSLNTDCEIASGFHPTIIDLAVEYLKIVVENEKGASLKASDLAERVIL